MDKLTILKAYLLARHRKNWSRKTLEKYQTQRLKQLRAYAINHSPYYAELYRNRASFQDLPIISKKEMMSNFSTLNTRGLEKETAFELALQGETSRQFDSNIKDLTIGLSSGTSGNRGIFLVSKQERLNWCGNILAKTLPHTIFKKQSIGLFLRANSKLYQTLQSSSITFTFFDLQKPLEDLIQAVMQEKPTILIAPPSLLRMLINHLGSYLPEKIISCAEVLDPIDESIISKAFKQPVHQIYQCTEGFLGYTCEHGTIHINEDLIYMEKEYIDQATGRFVPIITDLNRKTQPIIRYRLDDILHERTKPCPCESHFQTIQRIEGRCDDVLYFKTETRALKPIFPDFIRRQIITTNEHIQFYQFIQKSPQHIELYLDPYDPQVKDRIHKYLLEQGCTPPKITILHNPLKRSKDQKLRRITREFHV